MPDYFYVIPAQRWQGEIQPALAAAWHRRSFDSCHELCERLAATAEGFARSHRIDPDQLFVARIAEGMPFSKDAWRSLVGDLLMVSASLIPEIQTAPRTLCCLLAGTLTDEKQRADFTPIDQVHYGSRDLAFGGGFYRPEHAGLNDPSDVARLADYLAHIDTTTWTADQLMPLAEIADDDRDEELEFARQCLQRLTDLYNSVRQGHIIVCEVI